MQDMCLHPPQANYSFGVLLDVGVAYVPLSITEKGEVEIDMISSTPLHNSGSREALLSYLGLFGTIWGYFGAIFGLFWAHVELFWNILEL